MSTNPYEPGKLKEVMEREKMNWRSIADDGTVADKWNQPGTPLYYLIDSRGTIRGKWSGYPGQQALDAALEKLIQETASNRPGAVK
ncbi:MAG: hypothetical protein L0Z50_07280 [Verrucomicrobiales bacterium]|nr:hypothetical protein [Verrucomicrobiales bacterium]